MISFEQHFCMVNTNTEFSNKLASFFSIVQFAGILVYLTARFFYRELAWLAWLGFALMFSGYLYRMYADWKQGRKKVFRNRLVFLLIAIAFALLVGYWAETKS